MKQITWLDARKRGVIITHESREESPKRLRFNRCQFLARNVKTKFISKEITFVVFPLGIAFSEPDDAQRRQAATKQGTSARNLKIFFARSRRQDDLKALNHLATMILPTPIIFSLI
jgi:hypothetical protein